MTSPLPAQPEVNIGTAGHVDHGKTTLIKGLTGVWASKHSEELRRGITIRLGYADCAFYKCPSCPPPTCYTTQPTCPNCGGKTDFLRAVSFVDCPGHEVLMTTMLSGAAVMDGAILVIAADEPVPQPQTREHMAALEIVGANKIVVVQNKVDLVSKEKALENYKAIRAFLEGTVAEEAPIIPVSAQHMVNLDLLIEALERCIPTPKRDPKSSLFMHVVRSFDINKPGTKIEDLQGGVLGGTMVEGKLRVGEEIEIRPGIKWAESQNYRTLFTEVTSLHAGGKKVEEAGCGGLIGLGSKLDPSLTKADGLIGNVVGRPGQLPEAEKTLSFEPTLFQHVVGTPELTNVESVKLKESLVVNVGTAVSVGVVTLARKNHVEIALKKPVCAKHGARIALSRRIAGKWRLIGYGKLKG
ncbi:translation initiation factor IF-2 subunit gamma [Candidatus Hecatella orcuttiae]|uniref:translation initiation factor IF-2 subunit gamma n=1 Tax=Candidatus Hecatella orcuttiae TaxID=1935119 RepID=UPI00286821D4|nr:translation initiation factor IF-2 subunit gamma [Candidatus Hecatella orcuttiae]